MVFQDLDYVFTTLDIECKGYIEWIELQEFDATIYDEASLDIEQLEAAIETVCGASSDGKCHRLYFPDIAKELERRHVMEEKIKWDFCALDLESNGRISLESTLFLFKAIHNNRFSNNYWEKFLSERRNPDADVCLDEVKLYLCNIPEHDVDNNSDQDYEMCEKYLKNKSEVEKYDEYQQLQKLQETEEFLASLEKERVGHVNKIKNNANNLLNRMDEIGLQALLEDDFGDGQMYEGRPKEKVTATELLDALRDKYIVLRDELLLLMLRNNIGEGMWQVLSENERHEKLFQLKIKEEKLRKEGQLETLALDLPGARASLNYNVFSLLGESVPELEHRIKDQQEKVRESGLSIEEVVREFRKKLNDKEKQNSSACDLLLDLNYRYFFEKETLTKKLQGHGGYKTLTASDREIIMFSLVQAILRGMQEKAFMSCGICIGLSERVKPRNHDRSAKDPKRNHKLSSSRIQLYKDRRSLDGPILPPKLYSVKTRHGRVDLILQILQECEHRFSLERELLLKLMHSKEVMQQRVSVRKLANAECAKQLSVLYAQWLGWRNKSSSEKQALRTQIKNCLEEAVALRFEILKEEMKDDPSIVISDNDVSVSLLSSLQMKQDTKCQTYFNVDALDKDALEVLWKKQKIAIEEEWNENVAAIIFGVEEISKEETELLDALQNKYDILKDKLLMQSLMDQYGQNEWDKLSEKERQKRLIELKLQEKRLRKEGKFDEIAKLLGDSAMNSDILNKQLGDNRENYLNKLNERLRNRQRRIEAGEDPDTFDDDDMLEEPPVKTTGNLLKDLEERFEDERDALMKRLNEEDDRDSKERERQAELTRLRLEARKAGHEANFDSAALMLGLAERNKAALDDRLKNDRERQEMLARERLEARRKKKGAATDENITSDRVEPDKDDLVGWRDLVLKELAFAQEKEYNTFVDILQDQSSEDDRQEARGLSDDDRQERLNNLREKRSQLDFEVSTDQEQHFSIIEMASAFKFVICEEQLKSNSDEGNVVDNEKVSISLLANLQELHDEETRKTMDSVLDMNQENLIKFRDEFLRMRNETHLNNIAELVFRYEGAASDDEFVKALDKKYDTLLDKLALEAIEKQLSDAEWKAMSEKERQSKALQLKLKQKQLMKEGKLDEAAKLLGEGFEVDANLRKLMGDNRKKYDEKLKERLQRRKERIANGEEDVSDGEEEFEEEADLDANFVEGKTALSLLSNLQERYDDEKEALLARLHGADQSFMNEKERQAELIRLKREQRKAQKEGKFDTAAMMLGLAERNKAEADAKLSNDRSRHEAIAKDRLEKLRNRRAEKLAKGGEAEDEITEEEKDIEDKTDIHNRYMNLVEKRQLFEQEELAAYLQHIDAQFCENASVLSCSNRNDELMKFKASVLKTDDFKSLVNEMVAYKIMNRIDYLKSLDSDKTIGNEEASVSIMADLQERQNREDDEVFQILVSYTPEQVAELYKKELGYISLKRFPQLLNTLSSPDEIKASDEDILVDALNMKYDALKDKLILEGLEKQMGDVAWKTMNERERQQELLKVKLKQKKLKKEGKQDEASKIMNDLLKNDSNAKSLLGLSKAEQEERLKARLAKRKLLKNSGMNDEDIAAKEDAEDAAMEAELVEQSSGNVLMDLEKNFEAERDALINSLKDADSRLNQEKHRQLELARLRREAKKAKAEGKFDTAAMVLNMAKSQQAALEVKMKGDRTRQEKLAKERLEARRQRLLSKQQETEEDTAVEESNDIYSNVLNTMEKVHESERSFLLNLSQDKSGYEDKSLTIDERKKRLFILKELRKKWRESSDDTIEDQNSLLREALFLKVDDMKEESSGAKDDDQVYIQLLADLQDSQDVEAESLMQNLADKNSDTLKKLLEIQQQSLSKKHYDNVASVIFDVKKKSEDGDSSVEDELTDALKEKYDALKEKIYEEALRAKYDQATWDAMSEKEKEELIANMKANEELSGSSGDDLDGVLLGDDKSTKKATDILKDLDGQFESEKEALMTSLRDASKRDDSERERQLKLALLRRDKMRIKREEKYDGAALLLNAAKENELAAESSYVNERSRQEQLAKERIATRRQKRKEQFESEKLKQEEEFNVKQDLLTVEKMEREGTIALHESILMEIEEKHYSEQDKMFELIQLTANEKLLETSKLPRDEQNTKMSAVSVSRNKIKAQCKDIINDGITAIEEGEKRKLEKTITEKRNEQSQILHDGLVLALVIKSNNLGKPVAVGDDINEDVTVALLADLQELQKLENDALVAALSEADKDTATNIKAELRKARSAGFLDNLAMVIFKQENAVVNEAAMKAEEQRLDAEAAAQLQELEMEMEKKRKELPTMSDDEMSKYMEELKRQEQRRKEGLNDQIAKQREMARQKLLARQKKRDDKLQENDFANSLILNADKANKRLREKTVAIQGAQKDLLSERLQRRRDDKKRKQQEEIEAIEKAKKEEKEEKSKAVEATGKYDTVTAAEGATTAKPEEVKPDAAVATKKKKAMPPLPGGGLKREKTVVEKAAVIPETKKQEMINVLMREQTSLAMKISSEQSRQEEQVRNLREQRRKRMQARETEAAAVLGLGQRQKTMVEERQKGERERQIELIRDRVNRIKLERNSANGSRGEKVEGSESSATPPPAAQAPSDETKKDDPPAS